MNDDSRRAWRLIVNRWGGMAAALLGASFLLTSLLDISRPDSHFWELLREGTQYLWIGILPHLLAMALYGLLFVVGVRWWLQGQREAAKRVPPAAFRHRYLRACGAIVIVLASACLFYLSWLFVQTGVSFSNAAVLAAGFVADALLLAGGSFRVLWATAGLCMRRNAGIAEGAFGIFAGLVLLGSRYSPGLSVLCLPAMVLGFAGGIVAFRSAADALLLFQSRPVVT